MLSQAIFLLAFITAPSLATNTAGDPTDLANWPPCAQECIPQGFGPPANCGSLSNLTCICREGAFSAQITECEQLGCSSQEFTDIGTLSERLCAPVGGVGPAISATVAAILSSTQLSISTTPTIPPGVTGSAQVSSVLATATLAPNQGNPANINSYPRCAQACNNETIALAEAEGRPYGDTSNLEVSCNADFRSATAGCEAATCNVTDYQSTQLLAQQLCGSLYSRNATLGSAVSSAIASATAAAKAATDGKDANDLSVYPACAQTCIPQNNFNGCGSYTNLACVCNSVQFRNGVIPCEQASCSAADLQTITFLGEKHCAPAGGILTGAGNATAGGGNITNPSSTPVPFTGGTAKGLSLGVGWTAGGIVVGLAGLLVL